MTDDLVNPEDKTLNRLISGLKLEERHDLLEKLKNQSTLSFAPLYETAGEKEKIDNFDALYPKLPWYTRFFYSFLSVFKSVSPAKTFEENHLNRLGRQIQISAPGLFNYQQRLLLPGFYGLLMDLKESARFFFTALDSSVNQDRGSFYAFMGSLEMGDIHSKLQAETTPNAILEINPDAQEPEMRSLALRIMEDAFGQITDIQRNVMYYNARSLNCLKELSAFPFDRLLLSFGHSGSGQTCPLNAVRELLASLNNILFSLKDPPTHSLLETLFVFQLHGKKDDSDFNMDVEMQKLLACSEEAIAAIRHFNRKVHLTRLLRFAYRNMSFAPAQISGGENWLLVYREHWKRQVESSLSEFIQRNKHQEMQQTFKIFLKDAKLRILENAASEDNPGGFPLSGAFMLAFLRTFHSSVFINDINEVLKPILLEGVFFKKENRAEFTGAYNDLMKLEEDIKKIDTMISPEGEYGKRYTQVKSDITSLPVKRKRVQLVLDEVSREAKDIIVRTIGASMTMINVLGGIQNKEAGGKFDSLSNLEKLGGKNHEAFLSGIDETIKQFQQLLKILKELEFLGTSSSTQ